MIFEKIFEQNVISLFANECQKNKTLFVSEDLNLEPYTTSAFNFKNGLINLGYSLGSYSRSASCIITTSLLELLIAVWIAEPLP